MITLLDRGNSKSAVEIAKGLHKRVNTADSEALLVDAYAARIASLREHHMILEAEALDKLVRERYPSAAGKLDRPTPIASTKPPGEIPLDDLLRPLADASISREERLKIEDVLRKRLDDPAALRTCAALPADHPLRTGAAAIEKAFHAVTSGPVSEDRVALPDISHRSPLAPWKALVRALAAFYSHDDASCDRHLQSIDPQSPPARVASVIRELLNGRSDVPLSPAAHSLSDKVGGIQTLRDALSELDTMLASGKKGKPILSAIEKAARACSEAAPDLVPRLRQRILVHTKVADIDVGRVFGALGGPPLLDAWFWLLFARAMEDPGEPVAMMACSTWAEFLMHAVHEGWFPRHGPEAAALYLHMADLLESIPPEMRDEFRREIRDFDGLRAMYEGQPREIRQALAGYDLSDRYYMYPEKLFQRACAIDPRPESFQRWLAWANQDENWKRGDQVAEAWRRALPGDARPLLHLMHSAGDREAFQKAIAYGEEAQRLDPLNPQVRRARLTFLIAAIVRDLQKRKPNLAERDLAMLDALPQAREGTRPAVIATFRWLVSQIRRDRSAAARQFALVSNSLASDNAAYLLCGGLAQLCGFRQRECDLPDRIQFAPEELQIAIAAKVLAVGEDLGIKFSMPQDWEPAVIRELEEAATSLDISQLRVLAAGAVNFERRELAYALSAAGLKRGGPTEARFLLVRAQALPSWEVERRKNCISAATELARRNRDMALVNEAVELRRSELGGFLFDMIGGPQQHVLDEQQLNRILKQERSATSFPTSRPPQPSPWMGGFEDGGFLDDDEDDDVFDDPAFDLFADEFARELEAEARRDRGRKRNRRDVPF